MTRYRVSGAMPVLGHEPGEEFDAELSRGLEARLFLSGALILAADYVPPPEPEAEAEEKPKPQSRSRKKKTTTSPDAAPAPDSEEE